MMTNISAVARRVCTVLGVLALHTVTPDAVRAQTPMTNGENHLGAITLPGQVDSWSFSAAQGDAISLSLGEVLGPGPDPGFWPWIRLRGPSGTEIGNSYDGVVAQVDVVAPLSGTYTVVVGSNDAGRDALGSYRLTLARTPAPFVVPSDDEGSDLTNGVNHRGRIHVGDLDQWTFTAAQGDALSVSLGEVLESEIDPGFWPWLRLRSPSGATIGNTYDGWVAQIDVTAPLSGTYTVIVGTADAGRDAVGDYQLTLARTPAPFVVPTGDQGGAMTNGFNHPGQIHRGDLDQWTFTAAQGDALSVSVGEVLESEIDPGFWPWIRLRSPSGAEIGNTYDNWVAQIDVTAPLSGTYTVIVGTADAGRDAVGHYQLLLARTPAPFVVPTGDQGGAMTNGFNHPGQIHRGDLDLWTFTAAQGDALSVSLGEVLDSEVDPGFWPWIRLRSPSGATIGNTYNGWVAQIDVTAPLSGTYTVIVGTADGGRDAVGDYRLTLARTPATFVVPTGDDGGAMTNGANHRGVIHLGDLDQWTFTAAQGDALSVSLGEVLDSEVDPGFWPWIRLRSPSGAEIGNTYDNWVAQIDVTAPLSGTYTVVVGTADSGRDAEGEYQLTLARTPAPFVVPTGDDGGAMTNETNHEGAIHVGDLDQWTFRAEQGRALVVAISEVPGGESTPDFWPWIRVRTPTGTTVGNTYAAASAQLALTAPVSGLYTVVVGTADGGRDGEGRYLLRVSGASACAPTVSSTIITAPEGGGTGTLAVATLPSCTWTASSSVPWVTLTPGSGDGPGTVTYTVAASPGGTARATTVNVAGTLVTVTQSPVATAGDSDGDGMSDEWELKVGLDPFRVDAGEDADGDGRSNLQELGDGTHPRGFVITYLAEGATGAFFTTQLALANPTDTEAHVLIRFQRGDGRVFRYDVPIAPMARHTLDVATVAGLSAAEFSTLIEADVAIVADRTMSWDARGYGAHAERGLVTRAATTWYLAEGATHSGFELFYLIQNPTTEAATVQVTYLRPAPAPPLTKTYTVGPASRFNIWVDNEALVDPALAPLAATDISAIVTSTNAVPIIVERSMYLHAAGATFGAGHESAGVTELSTTWFLAEGATGPFFDLFVLIANPTTSDTVVEAKFLLPSGDVLTKQYPVPALSRFNIWVDHEDARLADTAVSTTITSLGGVPVVVERSMWWPGTPAAAGWYEAHNSPGSTTTGTAWALAEGETGGARGRETYVLIANTSAFDGQARVTLLFEDGTTATNTFPLTANSRFNVAMTAMFPASADRRYGTLVESLGDTPAQIVVERAMYWDATGQVWAAGTNALATKVR